MCQHAPGPHEPDDSDQQPEIKDAATETIVESNDDSTGEESPSSTSKPESRRRRKRKVAKHDVAEQRLLGRRSMCKDVSQIAPNMLKTVKLRVLGRFLESTKGMDDSDLENAILAGRGKLTHKDRIVSELNTVDPDVNRRNLKELVIYGVLLQEETYSLEENRLDEKVQEYEKRLVKLSKELDFFDVRKHDQGRWHHYDTYRIVLEAAWANKEDISFDEASLLKVLRNHLNISREEHWLIGAHIKRFPKQGCVLHTRDEIHDARKELQRESILWSYRDENNRNIDVIPTEVMQIIRSSVANLELQDTNYNRLLQHDSITHGDLKSILQSRSMDKYGNKADLIARIVESDVPPSEILDLLALPKLSEMCRLVGLKSSGNKPNLVNRLIEFYDDLTFEERDSKDEREIWYSNYELLAARRYSDLRAKKLISKDLEVEHRFEDATNFLFEQRLHVNIDASRKVTKADGRIPLENGQVILWDCKSDEKAVNLQDHLEQQFDGYLRLEREKGNLPLAFLVIGPSFTKQSLKEAYRFKARTNWDIALVQADALKFLAEHWSTSEPDKPFPVRILNRTELIDRERAEFLLSLA